MNQSSQRLSVARLTLIDFRNFGHLALNLTPQCVVLTGHNGSGKTNCLEAVSLLSPGRGLRGAAASDFARHQGPGGWSISARLLAGDRVIPVGTGFLPAASGEQPRKTARRTVKIDGETAASSTALGETAAVLWLTPAMDGLFTGPASERRRFLDRLTSTCHPSHRSLLARFDLAMRQRNRLLAMGERQPRLYDAYERQMAETGVAIAAARVEMVERLQALIAARHNVADPAAFPWAQLALEGDLETAIRHSPALEVEDDYVRILAEGREQDRNAGRTKTGPHATDLVVGYGPKDVLARLSSTGEQKSLLIGLILAQADLVKEMRGGQAPIILLDEIAAHLDERRREALFKEIIRLDSQTWMTGTDMAAFLPLGDAAQFLHVSEGVVTIAETGKATAKTSVAAAKQGMRAQ